jgi:hypothetical protein
MKITIRFNGNTMITKNKFKFPHTKKNSSVQFSITFSIKLKETSGEWKNILHLGETNSDRSPAIWFNNKHRYFHFRLSTTGNMNDGIDLHDIKFNKWYHVSDIINIQDWVYHNREENDHYKKREIKSRN